MSGSRNKYSYQLALLEQLLQEKRVNPHLRVEYEESCILEIERHSANYKQLPDPDINTRYTDCDITQTHKMFGKNQ